jgi:hypothetical protein
MNEQLPEYYGDVFQLTTNVWGVSLVFGLSVPKPKEDATARDVCVVRISHETAKALSMMLRQQLKNYERDMQTFIALPSKVMMDLGLAMEDW